MSGRPLLVDGARAIEPGVVALVGAGPGDPGLITRRGLEVLRAADVVVYDRLVSDELLLEARPDARLIAAGKRPGDHTLEQREINELLAAEAAAGRSVCRLKGGDPFVFGRGGEEADHLRARGIAFEIVPGVTSAIAGPAYAGIPVTDRRFASSLAVVTGHRAADGGQVDWEGIARSVDTLVVLMGMGNLEHIAGALVAGGRDPDTPAAVIQWAGTGRQASVVSKLGDIVEEVRRRGLGSPAVAVVGEAALLGDRLQWFEGRPLHGLRVAVTRPRERAAALARLLRRSGAEPVVCPLIRTEPLPADRQRLRALLHEHWDWMLFTSPSGVECFGRQLRRAGLDWRALAGARLAAVGPGTESALERAGLLADFAPSSALGSALGEELPASVGARALLPGAAGAGASLVRALTARGVEVQLAPVYRTVADERGGAAFASAIGHGAVEVVTFASGSAVRRAAALVGPEALNRHVLVYIGPASARTGAELGLRADTVAAEHSAAGLAATLVAAMAERIPAVPEV